MAPPLGGTRDRVPPASDTVSREGLKPNAETHCGSVHESPVRFTARAPLLIMLCGVSLLSCLHISKSLRARRGSSPPVSSE
jgi:hypothetical protein